MSWSFGAYLHETKGPADVGPALEAAMLDAQQQAGEWGPETRHQAQAAVNAALQLIDSGALGAGDYAVYLSGHANPGHQLFPGGPGDSCAVTVERIKPAGS